MQVNNAASLSNGVPKTAWAVLSDPQKNIQFSSQGYQYWADISATGSATFNGVVPGTYRLSVYVLGQWGELRQDGIVVSANATTTVPAVSFVPENFGGETVFTIGTPDRSGHEFLHGHDAQGHDDREFWGTWNYWADFLANSGAVIYNATAGPNGPATNDLSKWNYNHWGTFDPGLYDASNDSTDNYKNVIPSYVASLTGAAGTNGITTRLPSWTVHFASPADVANYQFAVVSVALACDEGSYVLDLNGTSSNNARTWSFTNASDCAVRSGLSGYTQWVAFQFPIVALKGAGLDNVLSIGISQTTGDMDDAIRLELTNTGAAPATTGWNDLRIRTDVQHLKHHPRQRHSPQPVRGLASRKAQRLHGGVELFKLVAFNLPWGLFLRHRSVRDARSLAFEKSGRLQFAEDAGRDEGGHDGDREVEREDERQDRWMRKGCGVEVQLADGEGCGGAD